MSSKTPSPRQSAVGLRSVPFEPPDTVIPAALSNLPRPLTSLIGRETDAATACARLVDGGVRFLTLTGPGGVGKTRLALRIAEEVMPAFADGVVFVSLALISDSELVLPTIVRELGLRETSAQAPFDHVAGYLRERRLLLVLDNFEQVRPAAIHLAALLATCPGLALLVTSRALLRVGGEQRFPVSPLALPVSRGVEESRSREADGKKVSQDIERSEAVRLFMERAQAVDPALTLTESNAHAVGEICRRLDGLPLAIELAAAHLRFFSPRELLSRLDPAMPLLVDGPDDAPDRLRTMRQAIAWSYDLLSPAEQTLFRRLAIFVGGFTLEAAEYVGGRFAEGGRFAQGGERGEEDDERSLPRAPVPPQAAHGRPPQRSAPLLPPREAPSSVLDGIASLVDKSLLQLEPSDEWESRFTMLETVREFALERLAEHGAAAASAARHAAYTVWLAERAESELVGPEERRWEARWDAELGNLRAALSWALAHDRASALRIGAALWGYWAWHNVAEGRRWLTAALAEPVLTASLVRARALTTSAALAALEGDTAGGLASANAAVPLAREAGDRLAEGRARFIAGCAHFVAGRVEESAGEFDHALPLLALATTSTDRGWAAHARSLRGATAMMMGEHAQGLVYYEDALALARDVGTSGLTLVILSDFAGWLVDRGESSRARGMLEEALGLAAEHRQTWLAIITLISLALVDATEGKAAVAARRLGAVEAMRFQAGLITPEHYQRRVDRATELAKDALGEGSYATAWMAGRADPAATVAEASGPHRDASTAAVAFSHREREVLRFLVAGLSDKEIGAALGFGRRTAATHVAAIRAKLDAPSRTAAAAIAVRDGLL